MTRAPRLLLVSPAFHGYHRSIAAAFEGLGYTVATHCYDSYATLGSKVRNKLVHELPARLRVSGLGLGGETAARAWASERTLRVVAAFRPDRVVVIKGDMLDARVWEDLHRRGIPSTLWLYDDLARQEHSLDFLRAVGPVLSYSADETALLAREGVDAHFVPNGFDPHLAASTATRREEVVFVGSWYPTRERLLLDVQRAGVPVRTWGRGWSHHPADRLRTWRWARPALAAERDIPLAEAYRVQSEGLLAVNSHGAQAGLSMRTFEVPGMAGLQAVDRPDVARFYEVGTETLVYRCAEELVEHARRARTDRAWAERIRERGRRRTLAEHTFAHRAAAIERCWA
ncbi:glycosyltransferase [Kocuria sp.]|uniref:CgeB family protein n=1 Tax=Kocuria sp. TaxID=1871328 RepID=UPI0026DBFF6C|nr:glycosyltransferase [Kocuria sp.]MDO4919665.1 glycosyltransferase [Kocuria sp.]